MIWLGTAGGTLSATIPPPDDTTVATPTDEEGGTPAPPPPPTTTPGTGTGDGPPRLVVIPDGCPEPGVAALAFVGTVTGKDDIAQVVRFHIDQLRVRVGEDWAVDGLIDVRFGDDYRFLDVGKQYLVGAGFDPEYAALSSNVRPPEPEFGGNDVVGVDDSAVDCPKVDDPVRTLMVDGTDVDSGVMSLLFDDRRCRSPRSPCPPRSRSPRWWCSCCSGCRSGLPARACSSSDGRRSRRCPITVPFGSGATGPTSQLTN